MTDDARQPNQPNQQPLDPDSSGFYKPLGDDTWMPTLHSQGAWREDEQHMAPVAGIITEAIARHEHRDEMQIAQISFDILGMIPAEPSTVTTRTTRPGRTIELVEAEMSVRGRTVVRAHAWRLQRTDTQAVEGVALDPMPGPDAFPPFEGMTIWGGGYIDDLEFRADPDREPGRGRVWLRSKRSLIEGETASPVAEFVRLVDTANGVAVRQNPKDWMFPNVDLSVHLLREPVPGWLGLDVRQSYGPTGLGLTSATLHDINGPVGRSEQILTVRSW